MKQPTFQGSTAAELIAFALENGVELPADMGKNDAWKEVKKILADLGQKPAGDDEEPKPAASASKASKADKIPTHYTIQVSKPSDTKLPDFAPCINGTIYQIHFGKKVKVPASVVDVLNNAVERRAAYRDMETDQMMPESFEPRFSFAIHEEHFE